MISILFCGFGIIGLCIQSFGLSGGRLVAVLVIPSLIWLLGYLAQEGRLGPYAYDALLDIPFFGPLYERIFRPVTYYKMDTALMFQSAVHTAVMEVIDSLTKEKGVRALSEIERKPIMREFGPR